MKRRSLLTFDVTTKTLDFLVLKSDFFGQSSDLRLMAAQFITELHSYKNEDHDRAEEQQVCGHLKSKSFSYPLQETWEHREHERDARNAQP